MNGVYGYKVTGPNGKSIFLPAAGYRGVTSLGDAGSRGLYWTRTLSTRLPYSAYHLYFNSGDVDWAIYDRYSGRSVRPVRR